MPALREIYFRNHYHDPHWSVPLPSALDVEEADSIARSTTEAELIALATAMFSEVENLHAVLETILGIDVPVLYHQDNSTLLAVLKTGYSAKLSHANGVHRVNIASVCDRLAEPRASIAYCKTDEQRANGFTKIVSPQEWPATLEQMGIPCYCFICCRSSTC